MTARFDQITDVETLQQIATMQARELDSMQRRIAELTRELSRLRGDDSDRQLSLELDRLQKRLAVLQRRMFAASSEKRPRESETAEKEEPASRKPARGHGPTPQRKLPSIEQEHSLSEEERRCTVCDGILEEMGQTEDADEVDLIQRQYVVVKHRRKKYRCKCQAAVVTAPGPRKLVPGGRYSVPFAVDVAVAKYLDHLPLKRQTRIMEREGLVVKPQALWDQLDALAAHLEPSYRALHTYVRDAEIVQADETYWRLLEKRKSGPKWWAWSLATDDAVYYRILPRRSAEEAKVVLDGYKGVVVCDGYTVYDNLARAGPNLVLAHCRVGGGVATPAPHRPGRADFPHPVPHVAASLEMV